MAVFYSQERSGWLGRPSRFGLRTMCEQSKVGQPLWTQPDDHRITGWCAVAASASMNYQLLSVLNGEMSLIGPRPERPELEHDLKDISLLP